MEILKIHFHPQNPTWDRYVTKIIYGSIELTSYIDLFIFDVFQPVSIAEISKGQNCFQWNIQSRIVSKYARVTRVPSSTSSCDKGQQAIVLLLINRGFLFKTIETEQHLVMLTTKWRIVDVFFLLSWYIFASSLFGTRSCQIYFH